MKDEIIKELGDLLKNKLEATTENSELSYNLSTVDMKRIVQLIDKVKETDVKEIEIKSKVICYFKK